MLKLLPLLAWAALGIVVLLVGRYVVIVLSLRRLRFAPATAAEYIDLDELPGEQRRLLDLAVPGLCDLGFVPQYALRMPATLVSHPPNVQYATACLHGTSGAWAVVALRDEPEYDNLYVVSFYTFYAHGPHLYTTARRGHEQIVIHPAVSALDIDGGLAQQWQTHAERMAQRGADEVLRDRDVLEAIERRMPGEARAAACEAGLLEPCADGTAQFTWRGAWRMLRAYQRGMARLAQHPLGVERANGIDAAAPQATTLRASADAIAIGKALAARRHDPGRGSKGWLLLITGLLSLLMFGWQFDRSFALVLVAVLLLHELGHLLVMRWAGYRDLQVFFIPLFGAVASGREEHVAAWKKMLVLLAGPLPGIALGVAFLHGLVTHALPAQGWLFVITSTLLVINLFNLLPFLPLDGGRLLDLLVFTRLPRLRGLFAALGAVALLVGGVWMQTPLMAVLGGVLVLTLPGQFRHGRMLASLSRVHGEGLDEEGRWLRALGEMLTAAPYGVLRFGQRLALAQTIARGGMGPPPAVSTVVIGLLLYCMSLVLPLWVLAQHGLDIVAKVRDSYAVQVPASAPRNYEQELANAANDEVRFSIFFAAASDAEDSEDFSAAHGYYQRAATLAGQAAAYQAQRVEATIGIARTAEDDATARVQLQDLLKSLVGDDRATRLQCAALLSELSVDFSPQTSAANLARMEQVVAIRAALLSPADPALMQARRALAWRLWQADRADEAVTQLRARAQALAARSCDKECALRDAWTRNQVYADLAWLLLARGQHAAATQLAQDYPALLLKNAKPVSGVDDTLPVLAAWMHHANGDHRAAIATMSALLEMDGSQRSVFAEQAGDRTAQADWTDRLRERVAELRAKSPRLSLGWLAGAAKAPYSWSALRLEHELSWLAAHQPGLLNGAP